jgi:hypothetical protein
MTTFLVIANIVLVLTVLLLLFIAKKPRNTVFSSLEDIELIEFQQNLKELIEQLHKVSENEINDMSLKKKEMEETIASAEAKIKELRYLVDRNQLIRKSEYKSAIAAGPLQHEDLLFMEIKKPQQAEPVKRQKPAPAKFSMNDAPASDGGEQAGQQEDNRPKNKYEHINTLIRNGLAIEEIAKVTGLSRGEIELIKNIKR